MVPPKGVHLPISKLHSVLAHNNISQICYCGQISLQNAAVNCRFFDNLVLLGVSFVLLPIVGTYVFENIYFHFAIGARNGTMCQSCSILNIRNTCFYIPFHRPPKWKLITYRGSLLFNL